MAASPSSVDATSDAEHPSSPAQTEGKSFISRADLDDEDTTIIATPSEAAEKPARGKGKGKDKDKDKDAQPQIGKIRHLKKEDGEPLWRKDIQYDFLRAVFDDDHKVFTNSYDSELEKQCFADLYIDTMARSSKTSKVLRDKLMNDREAAKGMAMVCLLVNMGRMNTTLNFFPEMRAQLRTYHAIPSLQAQQDPHAYKQLQDAPRLKSILKGGAEDRDEPNSLDKIKQRDIPRTNPVNLIFVMCNSAQKVAELHFPLNREFHDVIMKTQYSSKSRAAAFLWLMWFYLESDFTEEGCEENPFGPGVDYGLDVANQGVPELEEMTEEQEAAENIDPEVEIEFGHEKQKIRATILEMDHQFLTEREKRGKARPSLGDDGPAILPRIRPSKHESDIESTRSTPPRSLARLAINGRRQAPLKYQIFEGSSPARHGAEGVVARKPRPPTAHQLAVERNRSQRVEYILDRGLRKHHHRSRKVRRQEGAIVRTYKRLQAQADPFEDSDGEGHAPRNIPVNGDKGNSVFRERGIGGLCLLATDTDDYGEEVSSYAAAIRRSTRRLARWRGHEAELGVIAAIKKPKPATANEGANGEIVVDVSDHLATEASDLKVNGNASKEDDKDANGDATMLDDVEMEEVDQTALADEDIDDPDKTEVMVDSEVE
ncbi:ino eighty subunit 1 [Trichoderma arundinaceum]|uniref:Ino eighty subunit 1 n=1 Tax=Trichoderma arundinaceum TaxID=490622 RepID=A0A395NLK0_TRIAR|nr:ino eighty subunit 1 [Trichoderma arundinaceum]